MQTSFRVPSWMVAAALLPGCGFLVSAQTIADRVVVPVDESRVVTLAGNTHPMARSEFDLGPVNEATPLRQMVLQLEPSPAQQAELDALVEAQHDPRSPLYQQWLTPAQYGARFGASAHDIARVANWLAGHGFKVEQIPPGNRLIVFSGTAAQVAETFHTEIHRLNVNGVEHIANLQDPQIPEAFAGVVGGVVSLHDFRRQSAITARRSMEAKPESTAYRTPGQFRISGQAATAPQYTANGENMLFPADWATIYDLNSLYAAGTTGSGVTIAIVGRSNIVPLDVTEFRQASGLPANPPNILFVNGNPGLVSGDQDESTLDVEWSGAIAPGATVKFVVGSSTSTTDGVDLSAQYIVNHVAAQVMSTSYGSCEQDMGATENAFYNGLWEQAASEGISAFVSSGDSGAAGCYPGSDSSASGKGVNGLCSSPYSTCVGGTEFNEGGNNSEYWGSNSSTTYGSAKSYIPEEVWNESGVNGGSGLWGSTGGISVVYTQPAWQKGVSGTAAANGMRAVPDIAMDAAGHDPYAIVEDDQYWLISGTSAASPSFAGVMALVVQSEGGKGQGNANPGLYALLNAAHNPFHPTPSGNNSVPGVTGFTANGAPYNLATGLGSVDGALLVSAWGTGTTGSGKDFTLTASSSSATLLQGKSISYTVTVTESGNGKSAVALTVKAPTGITATVSPASITPGTTATVTLTAGTSVTGAQSIIVTGSDASGMQTLNYALTVNVPPGLTLGVPTATVVTAVGTPGTLLFTAATTGAYTGNITLSLTGLPAGVTAGWSSNPIAGATGTSSNTSTLTLTASGAAAPGTSTLTVTASGDGLTATQKIAVTVQQAPGATLASSPASASMQSMATAAVTVTATPVGGMSVATGAAGSSIAVASGLPKGVTASWSAPSVNQAGAVVWTLTLTGSATAVAGTSTLGLAAKVAAKSGTTYSVTENLPLTVTLTPPTLSLAAAANSVSVVQGKSVTDLLTLTGNATFSGPVSLSVSGLPAGVTASWSSNPATLSSLTGGSVLSIATTGSATVGTATLTVTAKGDGLSVSKQISLQVQQAPGIQALLSSGALSMTHTGAASVTVMVTPLGGATGTIVVGATGVPAGVAASFGAPASGQSGSESIAFTLTGSSSAKAGTTQVTVNATIGSGASAHTASQVLTLTLH